MRTGAPAAQEGYFHEAAFYDSDEGLLHAVVPHVEAGVHVGEPTFVSLPRRDADLVRSALGSEPGVTFLSPLADQRPATAIKRVSGLLHSLVAEGFQQIRVMSTVPHPGLGVPWHGWCRYEAAVNHLLADFPVWGVCLYDRRITPTDVLADVARTHPHIANDADAHQLNPRYEDPEAFLQTMPPPPPDPLEAGTPAVEIVDPTAAEGRRAVRAVALSSRVSPDSVDDLILATSEAIANAATYGRPPVTMTVWTDADRIVVAVSDHGDGPEDPYAGLVARPSAVDGTGGYGLWILHQLVAATHSRREDGFTVRLATAEPAT